MKEVKEKISIIVPCYNEEEVLHETTRQLADILVQMKKNHQIEEGCLMYVDDGSKDMTWTLIEKLSEEYSCVLGLKLAHNVGHQQALWAGLEWAAKSKFNAIISIFIFFINIYFYTFEVCCLNFIFIIPIAFPSTI